MGDKATAIEHWPIDRLRPYERNARTHDEDQVAKLEASIREFGMVGAIVVRDEVIAKGHGTLMAIRRIYAAGDLLFPAPGEQGGAEPFEPGHVPVLNVSGWSDSQFRAFVIADNRLALDAGWDEDLLAEELLCLQGDGFDIDVLGFSDDELADLLPEFDDEPVAAEPTADEDDVPDAEPVPVARRGDLWRLGRHRLLCGDSTSQAEVGRLLDGRRAACLWTDPPYNVNYEGSAGKILNDHMGDAEFNAFLAAVFETAHAHLEDGAPAYIAHDDAGPMGVAFRVQFMAAGFHLASCLIWRKNTFVLGRSDYHWQHEPILYGWKKGAAHTWYGDRKKTTVLDDEHQLVTRTGENEYQINLGETGLIVRGDNVEVLPVTGSVIVEEKPKRNSDHPTMKPVALIERMLRNSAKRGDTVLDLFGGSGSTLIACEKLGMSARLMELDPRFVDVIVRRWQDFTGRVARLDGTDETFAEVEARRDGAAVPIRQVGMMTAGRPFTESPAANDDATEAGQVA